MVSVSTMIIDYERRRIFGDEIMLRSGSSRFPLAFKYRDRTSIIEDILRSVKNSKNGRKKTQIMQSANLNYRQMKKYITYMLNCGYLTVTDGQTYIITENGSRFLRWIEAQRIQKL